MFFFLEYNSFMLLSLPNYAAILLASLKILIMQMFVFLSVEQFMNNDCCLPLSLGGPAL